MNFKIYIHDKSFTVITPKICKQSEFVVGAVHDTLTYKVTVIGNTSPFYGFYSTEFLDGEVWVYCSSIGRTVKVSCSLDSIDFGSYYMTKLVRNRKIQEIGYSYAGTYTERSDRDFEMKFGKINFDDEDSLVRKKIRRME